jgi:hypothetical protein
MSVASDQSPLALYSQYTLLNLSPPLIGIFPQFRGLV